MPMFHFDGHPAEKQSVASPDEDACVPGIGRWPKDAERIVSDEIAAMLRHARGFREVAETTPETDAGTAPETSPDAETSPEPTPEADAAEVAGHVQGDE